MLAATLQLKQQEPQPHTDDFTRQHRERYRSRSLSSEDYLPPSRRHSLSSSDNSASDCEESATNGNETPVIQSAGENRDYLKLISFGFSREAAETYVGLIYSSGNSGAFSLVNWITMLIGNSALATRPDDVDETARRLEKFGFTNCAAKTFAQLIFNSGHHNRFTLHEWLTRFLENCEAPPATDLLTKSDVTITSKHFNEFSCKTFQPKDPPPNEKDNKNAWNNWITATADELKVKLEEVTKGKNDCDMLVFHAAVSSRIEDIVEHGVLDNNEMHLGRHEMDFSDRNGLYVGRSLSSALRWAATVNSRPAFDGNRYHGKPGAVLVSAMSLKSLKDSQIEFLDFYDMDGSSNRLPGLATSQQLWDATIRYFRSAKAVIVNKSDEAQAQTQARQFFDAQACLRGPTADSTRLDDWNHKRMQNQWSYDVLEEVRGWTNEVEYGSDVVPNALITRNEEQICFKTHELARLFLSKAVLVILLKPPSTSTNLTRQWRT